VLDLPYWLPTPAEAQPPELGHAHLTAAAADPSDLDFALPASGLDSESLRTVSPAKPRPAGAPGEDVGVGAVEVAQSLLENVRSRVAQPWQGALGVCQLAVLGGPPDPMAHAPGRLALLERGVPDRAGATRPATKGGLLIGRGVKAVAEARVLDHGSAPGSPLAVAEEAPGPDALLERGVVEIAGEPELLLELARLSGCRVSPVLAGALH
jgi:hypothetical protein